jgi:hypothetical protein
MEEKNKLKIAISVIEGLIDYHKRMTLPIRDLSCASEGCPAVEFENDVYLSALEESLRLLRREYEGLYQLDRPFHT